MLIKYETVRTVTGAKLYRLNSVIITKRFIDKHFLMFNNILIYFYYHKICIESFISTHFCPEFQQKQSNCLWPCCIWCLMATSSLPSFAHVQRWLGQILSEMKLTLPETYAHYSVHGELVYNAESSSFGGILVV